MLGHRIVHGGLAYSAPVLIDDKVLSDLGEFVPLAPLHQPHNIAAIRAVANAAPKVPQVACFDTAFHRSQPAIAQAFALPREYNAKGVRGYGFHGLSYEYIVSALPGVAPGCVGRKLIVAHLGNGASMCAIDQGRSVATTMGFTAVEGLPMGTRTGSLDPGVILYLLMHERMDARAIEQLIYDRSGLLGGLRASRATCALCLQAAHPLQRRRSICSSIASGANSARLLRPWAGSMPSSSPPVSASMQLPKFAPASVTRRARWLGVDLDADANARDGPRISSAKSKLSVWVVPTDENLMIARHTRQLLDRTVAPDRTVAHRSPMPP